MKRNIKLSLFFVLMIVVLLPQPAFAAGEYDGIWTGSEKVYIDNQLTDTLEGVYTVIYQQDENNLDLYDSTVGTIHLIKSGNDWVLSSSIDGTFEGYTIIINSMTLTFTSSTSLTASFNLMMDIGGSWYNASATISASKMVITTSLSNGVAVTNLAGSADSVSLFQIDVPSGSTGLTVTTSGGTGNCDIIILYSRPDFNMYTSELSGNNEEVYIPSPQSGRWYVALYGETSYSGVTLRSTYEAVQAPIADFIASPTRGRVPFDVSFTDQSTGDITSWSWNFGDGVTSMEQNPTHTYKSPGTYTVSLTVTGSGGTNTKEKTDFISGFKNNSMPWIPLLLLNE